MRDHRNGEMQPIDAHLLDVLFAVGCSLDSNSPFHIISGYRSAATNAQLTARSGEVARNSLHMLGKAVDVFLPGRELAQLHSAAFALHSGGVGYYPISRFAHIDTGCVRTWRGA